MGHDIRLLRDHAIGKGCLDLSELKVWRGLQEREGFGTPLEEAVEDVNAFLVEIDTAF